MSQTRRLRPAGGTGQVESWKRSVEAGTASGRCDELVRRVHAEAGIPQRLADALLRAPLAEAEAA